MGIDRDACIDATVTAGAVCEERYGHRPGRMHRRHSYGKGLCARKDMGIDRDACIDATVTTGAVCEERYGHRPGRTHRRHSYGRGCVRGKIWA